MPAGTARKATPRTRSAAVKVKTPDLDEVETAFELCGETYVARMPKDFVWMELIASTAPEATMAQRAAANSLFLRACLSDMDRDRIIARMMKSPKEDPCRGMELIACIRDLVVAWKPYIEGEFQEAVDRAGA